MNLKEIIVDCLEKVKAFDVVSIDMEGKSPFYDEMVLASVNVERTATAFIGYLEDALKDTDYKIRNVEGEYTSWVLVDCYDVVVSIFTKEERENFQIEKLYLDSPIHKY